ncbi:MAG: hypothetical protein ACNI27_07260 [Desulfovibrio sp.]
MVTELYECDHCEELYREQSDAIECEENCERQEWLEEPEQKACPSCVKQTKEGYTAVECKVKYDKFPQINCPEWEEAKR